MSPRRREREKNRLLKLWGVPFLVSVVEEDPYYGASGATGGRKEGVFFLSFSPSFCPWGPASSGLEGWLVGGRMDGGNNRRQNLNKHVRFGVILGKTLFGEPAERRGYLFAFFLQTSATTIRKAGKTVPHFFPITQPSLAT